MIVSMRQIFSHLSSQKRGALVILLSSAFQIYDQVTLPVVVKLEMNVSCFGSFGPTAVWCLFSLADLELRQHDSLLARQGLPHMLDPSARSQFRAICYRQISARIGHAVAKASVMRLLGVPRLPLAPFIPRDDLARNFLGLADSFSPVFLTCMSSLCSNPPPSSPPSSLAPSP